ncbi:alpha-ketoglutarate-dependent dioxygenase AlkB [Novilysobacter selenitireducens]|uniref:Alpha-ketoglutarate-dependent dioxygenase AlkB n=1 Tax=Novilysobacter selenitireducens TaxID=2872639 RepID=A0ABS7T5P5_9GAMM|nr:alpha-ketoglutarate-dependent dioxygenase AlkB [Lysobacter selenitireducens]MBZ4039202.1 alpha-ketoglutarate-dependent dioxygenase AlkB [Lysobacter selenitireducens]
MHALRALTDDLFAPAMHQLVDDEQGGIRYWPAAIDPDTARRWFDALREGAGWTHLQRPMYDRIVDVPRLLANYAVDHLPADLPLAGLLACVQARAPAPYSRIGMNLYRDGNDSVAMHGDKLHTLAAGHPITLVSLGAPRRMLIRARDGARETLSVDLAPGSVLSMSHASQQTHEHGIPKTRRAQGARISAVFRVRPTTE